MRRFGWLLSLLVGPVLLASCAIDDTADDTRAADETALVAAGGEWNALYSAQNWPALRALYEDDAWLMTDKAPAFRGADEIVEYLKRFADSGADVTFEFAPEDVVVDRPYGFVTAKYWMNAAMPDGTEIKTSGRSFLVYKWSDGEGGGTWRLWRDIDNTSPDVSSEPPPADTSS